MSDNNKKFFLLLALLIIITLFLTAYSLSASPLLKKTYGAVRTEFLYSEYTNANRTIRFNDFEQTSDEGYIVGDEIGPNAVDRADPFVMKLDQNSDVIANQTAAQSNQFYRELSLPSGYIRVMDAKQTSDGGFFIIGEVGPNGVGGSDAWIAKLDADGNLEMQTKYYDYNSTYPTSFKSIVPVSTTPNDDNYTFIAKTTSIDESEIETLIVQLTQTGQYITKKYFGSDEIEFTRAIYGVDDHMIATNRANSQWVGLVKVNQNGEIEWKSSVQYSRSLDDVIYDNGYYYAVGYVYEFVPFYTNEHRAWIGKFDLGGNLVEKRAFMGPDTYDAYIFDNIQKVPGDGFIVSGYYGYTNSSGPFFVAPWIVKLSENLTVEWQLISPDIYRHKINSIRVSEDGTYFIASGSRDDFVSNNAWIAKFNMQGQMAWQIEYGSSDVEDRATQAIPTTDGGVFVVGYTGGPNSGDSKSFILKLDSAGNILDCDSVRSSDVTYNNIGETSAHEDDASFYPGTGVVGQHAMGHDATNMDVIAFCALPSDDHMISGQVTDGHGHPLSDVFVGLLVDGQGTYTRTTTSNSEGIYEFDDVLPASTYRVRVILQDGSNRKQIQYGNDGLLVSAETEPFSVIGTPSTVKDIDFSDNSLISAPIPNENLDDLAIMYYHANQVEHFAINELNLSNFQAVNIIWGYVLTTTGAGYDPVSQSIEVGADISGYQPDLNKCSRPMNREWHESFHHLMNVSIGIPPLAGIEENHGGYNNSTTDDSWTEGWAEFWPAVLSDVLGERSPYVYVLNCFPISLELNWQVWDEFPENNPSNREEFAVASLLWDLYDPKESDDVDSVDLDLDSIWSVIGQTTSNNSLNDMRDVYVALKEATLTNEDGTLLTDANIDALFAVHGFFADTGNHLWNPGEEPGWGGRPNRRNTPIVENAYIKVNVENENGIPVEGAELSVDLVFENDHYDYSYKVELGQATENMVYLELPPIRTFTTANITAIHMGGRSETYSIENLTYWDEVANSTNGYAEEITFVIHYETYLPIVSR
ncbi:MAG: carboxypeptidase regulatory-like domain-containing protein [Anaerolineae bacterium]|nr:carboxypeptidase regulatory-like domain-containing protein [Anaerolineae bacterium]